MLQAAGPLISICDLVSIFGLHVSIWPFNIIRLQSLISDLESSVVLLTPSKYKGIP